MNEWLAALLRNQVFMSAIAAWTVAQLTKLGRDLWRGDFRWERITGAGGMPSSHSAMVVATTVASGLTVGFDSPFFAISFVFIFSAFLRSVAGCFNPPQHRQPANASVAFCWLFLLLFIGVVLL